MIITNTLSAHFLPARGAVVALGLFDGLHLGHCAVLNKTLETAREMGASPLCFTFSTSLNAPAAKEGITLLSTVRQMRHMLSAMGFYHVVSPDFDEFRSLSPEEFVREILAKRLGAAAVVCGEDYRFGRNASAGVNELATLCGESGIRCRVAPPVELDGAAVSSKRIRKMVREGDIPSANRLLGRCFSIDFEVVSGRRLGRSLGAPTINQPFPQEFTIPRFGVYATLVVASGKLYSGVTNVGVKPTVGSDYALAETYIRGFDGDLYGRSIEVRFLRFLRPERKFDSLDALREQISADAANAAETSGIYLDKHQDVPE